MIGSRRLLSLDNVSHKACVMRFMRSAIAPRRIGSADRRMTRGEYRLMTMCRAKSLFMHDAVDGGSRVFGCGGDPLTHSSCRCITTSCTKSRFYALMPSTAASEHSSATVSRRFRGSCRCVTTSCSKPHACVSYAMLCRMRPPSFWVHCIVDRSRGNYRLLNNVVA